MRFAAGRNLLLTAVGADTAISVENLWISGRLDATIGSANAGHSQSLVLQGLRLTPATIDATPTVRIRAAAGTQSTHAVTLYQSHVLEPATSAVARAAVRMESFYGGSATLSLQENQIMAASGGVALIADSPGASLYVQRNRIGRFRPATPTSAGLFIDMAPTAPGSIARVHRNQIFRFGVGTQAIARNAGFELNLLNNSIARNQNGIVLTREGSALGGRIANNIVAFQSACGLDYQSSGVSATADYNLYHDNLANRCSGAPTGAHDVLGNPGFVGGQDLRILPPSAAINAGNNADQPAIVIVVPIATPDYDSRSGRSGGIADIGAHEYSADASFIHQGSAANTSGNLTTIAPPPFPLFSFDALQFSSYGREAWMPALPPAADAHLGLWWDGSAWTIFRQTTGLGPAMPLGRRFQVLLDLDSNVSYVHSATATDISGNSTRLDRSGLNATPSALPIVSQRYNPNDVFNNSSIGVWYDGSRWRIFNQQPTLGLPPAMPEGASFNVLVPNPLFATGHHAFRSELAIATFSRFLDHPLLNDTACAHPFVTASYNPNNVYVPSALVIGRNVRADDGRTAWFIERGDGAQIPADAAFHVYVDPQQSRRCREELVFADEFD
ncbi:MAG: hypothetical protein IPO66_07210 [Rhodanobacteraceae bacterium]|nr:hypothetical protein [Rhodanobacteraceae bacterium]